MKQLSILSKMEKIDPLQRELPDKLYFKVGEVSSLSGVPAYVLRFWETEFKKINPRRTPSGQRLYKKADVELILKIKHLLYEKKYTIKGAKQHIGRKEIKNRKKTKKPTVDEIRIELIKILDILS